MDIHKKSNDHSFEISFINPDAPRDQQNFQKWRESIHYHLHWCELMIYEESECEDAYRQEILVKTTSAMEQFEKSLPPID